MGRGDVRLLRHWIACREPPEAVRGRRLRRRNVAAIPAVALAFPANANTVRTRDCVFHACERAERGQVIAIDSGPGENKGATR
jgi:hypothetical protein